jgi:hypothetical protein
MNATAQIFKGVFDNLADITIDSLVDDLIAAKRAEAESSKKRITIEEAIIKRVGQREEGAQTTELESGMKLTITGKLSYKADIDKLLELCQNLPSQFRPIKIETKLDETGVKFLRNNEPDLYKLIAQAITVKPAKTSVEVKA